MKQKKSIVLSVALSGMVLVLLNACRKEKVIGTDAELYSMAKESAGFTWYRNSDALLGKSSGSGHSQLFLRTRFNDIAAGKLDVSGKVQEGADFPEGSVIVKELWGSTAVLDRYAVLYKNQDSPNADAKGWVWGYLNADGSVAEPSSNKGAACMGCHSQQGNIDYILMNTYFP